MFYHLKMLYSRVSILPDLESTSQAYADTKLFHTSTWMESYFKWSFINSTVPFTSFGMQLLQGDMLRKLQHSQDSYLIRLLSPQINRMKKVFGEDTNSAATSSEGKVWSAEEQKAFGITGTKDRSTLYWIYQNKDISLLWEEWMKTISFLILLTRLLCVYLIKFFSLCVWICMMHSWKFAVIRKIISFAINDWHFLDLNC